MVGRGTWSNREPTTRNPETAVALVAGAALALAIIRILAPLVANNSSLPPAARVFFAAGLATCGCQARSKNLLRTTEGGEESYILIFDNYTLKLSCKQTLNMIYYRQ